MGASRTAAAAAAACFRRIVMPGYCGHHALPALFFYQMITGLKQA